MHAMAMGINAACIVTIRNHKIKLAGGRLKTNKILLSCGNP